jgi:NAD(P)-dependent dehydrogenase (short-subunit alcohol dehydrogenase family)
VAPLAGRRALVTGGASGIGAAIVERLAGAGASGWVVDLRAPAPGELAPGWRSLVADVGDEAALAAACGQAGPGLDVVVAAAGIVPPWRRLEALDLAEWDEVFRVNARGVASTLRHTVGSLGAGGAVVVVASVNAWRGDANLASYSASKHAVLGLVRSAALDLGGRGIRVNAVGPGPVATDALLGRMARRAAGGGAPVEEALTAAAAQTALGRIATAAEVAQAVLFLASDAASGITGQLLAVDGGLL